ncbi:MAG: hypothetical protein IT581_13985 [Verrucomicrobiales bacterium]|nr:hypothetical protein [Verrucomicrobiales bacterium]
MQQEQRQFLDLVGAPPVRLNVVQTASILNCQPHDIPTFVKARLLKPLGNPASNGTKYFATSEVLELARGRQWLSKMTNAIHQHWRRKKVGPSPSPTP